MPINDAFNLVLQIAGLNYYPQGNTMIILAKSSEDNANFSKQEMMTFPVKYVSATTIANFLNKNVFGMKIQIHFRAFICVVFEFIGHSFFLEVIINSFQ